MAASAFLLIDAGNTRVKCATAHSTGPIRVGKDWATEKFTRQVVEKLARKYPTQQVVLASVVPKVTSLLVYGFKTRLTRIGGNLPELGLVFDYPRPMELGADRLAAAVAAHAQDQFPVIIVSCGTATAFTVLDRRGVFCGGAIAAGLQTQLRTLLGSTAQLPPTRLHVPRAALARQTREAIRSGVLLSFQGGVKEIVIRLGESLGGKRPHVILTGGQASYLTETLNARVEPLLVMGGLRIIGGRLFPEIK